MNEVSFNILINDAVKFLKKLKIYKTRREFDIGKYSKASLDVSNSGDYKLIYDTAIDNMDYEILLEDDSIFQLRKEGDKYRYVFIQSKTAYISFKDFLSEFLEESEIPKSEEELEALKITYEDDFQQRRDEQKINIGATYLRYDADKLGYKPNLHSYAHFHIGLNNSLRLPCSRILTPFSFVLFSIKHFYSSLWQIAIVNNIVHDENYKFKSLCNEISGDYWTEIEKRDLYIT